MVKTYVGIDRVLETAISKAMESMAMTENNHHSEWYPSGASAQTIVTDTKCIHIITVTYQWAKAEEFQL
jgi:hypothetical protein